MALLPMDRQELGCVQNTGLQAGLSQEVLQPLRVQHSRAVAVGPSLDPIVDTDNRHLCLSDTLKDPQAEAPPILTATPKEGP